MTTQPIPEQDDQITDARVPVPPPVPEIPTAPEPATEEEQDEFDPTEEELVLIQKALSSKTIQKRMEGWNYTNEFMELIIMQMIRSDIKPTVANICSFVSYTKLKLDDASYEFETGEPRPKPAKTQPVQESNTPSRNALVELQQEAETDDNEAETDDTDDSEDSDSDYDIVGSGEDRIRYYSTSAIDRRNATYNVIFGERSNGKTYALLKKAVKGFVENGKQFAYVRRWKEDVTGRRAARLFAGISENGEVARLTHGEYSFIHYWAGKFYLANISEKTDKPIYRDEDCIGYTFALSDGEHDKSTSFPNVNLVVFDEFLTNRMYFTDEFVAFMNTVSTIVRRRTDVKIYMLGNTVNKYCPYFNEMGLTHVKEMKQGTIDLYTYGESDLTVAVEYCASSRSKKGAQKYFAFDNPKLKMITGGAWELDIYPHLPMKYKPKDVIAEFFIEFNSDLFHAEIVLLGDIPFVYIHAKTTDIKNPDTDMIYSLEPNPKLNYNVDIMRPITNFQTKVKWFFQTNRVFYQNNAVGDTIRNYLQAAKFA